MDCSLFANTLCHYRLGIEYTIQHAWGPIRLHCIACMSCICHMVSDMAMTHSLSLSKKLLGKGALYGEIQMRNYDSVIVLTK